MESAWMVDISSFNALLTIRCLSISFFPSNAGDTTSTSKLVPHLQSGCVVIVAAFEGSSALTWLHSSMAALPPWPVGNLTRH